MNKTKAILITLGLVLFAIYTKFFIDNLQESSEEACRFLGLFVIIQFIYTLYSWKKFTGSYFSAYSIFMIAFYLFNLGQVVLDFIGANYDAHLLLNGYLNQYQYFMAAYYSLACLLFFHFGALLTIKEEKDMNMMEEKDMNMMFWSIYTIAQRFALLVAPFYLYNLIIKLSVVAIYGYDAIYDSRNTSSYFVSLFADFYTPAMICLFFAAEYLKIKRELIVIIILFTIFFPSMLLGGRTNAGIIAAVLLIVYQLFHNISRKQALTIGLSAFVIMIAFNVIANTRNQTKVTSSEVKSLIKNDNNPFVSFLAETGFTMYPLGATMTLVPFTKEYEYGATYLWELTTIIPNVGLWDLHPAQKHDPSVWIQEQQGHSFGIAYSLIAEAYHNFGYLGLLFMILNGYLYTLFLSKINRKYLAHNPFIVVLAIMFFCASIKGVRNSFQGVVRGFVYYSFIIYYFIKLYYNKQKNLT